MALVKARKKKELIRKAGGPYTIFYLAGDPPITYYDIDSYLSIKKNVIVFNYSFFKAAAFKTTTNMYENVNTYM